MINIPPHKSTIHKLLSLSATLLNIVIMKYTPSKTNQGQLVSLAIATHPLPTKPL